MDPSTVTRLTFGEFTLELQPARLLKGEVSVPLQSQPLRLLSLLVAHAGEVVTHKEIQKHVWGELQVDFASGMHVCIGQIRKALEDVGEQPRFVETIPRRGYRFVAEVLPSCVSPVAAEDTAVRGDCTRSRPNTQAAGRGTAAVGCTCAGACLGATGTYRVRRSHCTSRQRLPGRHALAGHREPG